MDYEEKYKEDYVSFETAKLLKEKGFSENTICKYADVGGITERYYDDYRERVLSFDWEEGHLIEPLIVSKEQYEIIGDTIPAPSQANAIKWLRVNFGYNILIIADGDLGDLHYSYEIQEIDNKLLQVNGSLDIEDQRFNTYEEACEAAIKYSLENLI